MENYRKINLKENLIVIEEIRLQWISSNMSTNCPSPLSIIFKKIKDRVSRNIVGERELFPVDYSIWNNYIFYFPFF